MMRWVSIAELQALADPRYRLAAQNQYMQQCIAQAKLEQAERHHSEQMQASIAVAQIQGQAMIERERIKSEGAISLAAHTHALAQSAKSSALIDEMMLSIMRQDEEWNRTIADTMRTLIVTEADTIKQERLRKLEHEHLIEKLRLESNLRMMEMVLANELQDLRITFDKACDIIFRLVERALGLGQQLAETETIRDWVREAMGQTGTR